MQFANLQLGKAQIYAQSSKKKKNFKPSFRDSNIFLPSA